jgi:hypothetical protein
MNKKTLKHYLYVMALKKRQALALVEGQQPNKSEEPPQKQQDD